MIVDRIHKYYSIHFFQRTFLPFFYNRQDFVCVGKVTPTPDKVWVLDESGALVAEDKKWTNQQGVDQKTFMASIVPRTVGADSISARGALPLLQTSRVAGEH